MVLVEPTEDFTMCEVVREVSLLKQSPASLFPVVEIQFRWATVVYRIPVLVKGSTRKRRF